MKRGGPGVLVIQQISFKSGLLMNLEVNLIPDSSKQAYLA
jgi:hypothetical protein